MRVSKLERRTLSAVTTKPGLQWCPSPPGCECGDFPDAGEIVKLMTQFRARLAEDDAQARLAPIADLLLDSARQNEKRPAYVKLAMADELVKSLRGQRQQQDVLLLVRVPGEVLERSESRIVLPGEVE